MKLSMTIGAGAIAALLLVPATAGAEILAMVLYETKAEESLKALQLQAAPRERREGIAIVDVDPESETYGKWLVDIPLPRELVPHHLYYNNDLTKVYVTAIGNLTLLHVFDLTRNPWRVRAIDIPECRISEVIAFSGDGATWYMACLGSDNVIVGDAVTDQAIATIDLPEPYPHGIGLNEEIDRMLVTSSNAPDLSDNRERIVSVEISTRTPLSSYKVSNLPSPSGVSPGSIVFIPGTSPPIAYVNNWTGRTLWAAVWTPEVNDFAVQQLYDFGPTEHEFPIEMKVNTALGRMYMTTGLPGSFHIFDIGEDVLNPVLLKTLPAAPGAHHIAVTADERYAFVQNGLGNIPGVNDGSITVIDLVSEETIGSVDTLKDQGLTLNFILLLPEWYHRTIG